jgi:hypothetical protein
MWQTHVSLHKMCCACLYVRCALGGYRAAYSVPLCFLLFAMYCVMRERGGQPAKPLHASLVQVGSVTGLSRSCANGADALPSPRAARARACPLWHGARACVALRPHARPSTVRRRPSNVDEVRRARARSTAMSRAQLGPLLGVGARSRSVACALQWANPRHSDRRAPDPQRATRSDPPSVCVSRRSTPSQSGFLWVAFRGDGPSYTGASPAARARSLPSARARDSRTPTAERGTLRTVALSSHWRTAPSAGLRRSSCRVPDRPTTELEAADARCGADPHACRPPARHALPIQSPHAASAAPRTSGLVLHHTSAIHPRATPRATQRANVAPA